MHKELLCQLQSNSGPDHSVVTEIRFKLFKRDHLVVIRVDSCQTGGKDLLCQVPVPLLLLQKIFQQEAKFFKIELTTIISIVPSPHFLHVLVCERSNSELPKELFCIKRPRHISEVLHRLHLQQSAHGTVPRKDLIERCVLLVFLRNLEERDWVCGRCAQELGVAIVQGVDEGYEATDLIALLQCQLWDVGQEHRVEGSPYSKIIGSTKRLVTEI
mmetsp:Transcript_29646/g.78555  ORF Transcript_29646/g.78555 Transcript_29646/m.78555 type:complete len:215 (+) Transcript_29646:294-938(+)